jgi:hypothetical protein
MEAVCEMSGQKWSLLLKDRVYDNVQHFQGYRTPPRAVVDEYGAMVEWQLTGENQRNSEEKPTYGCTHSFVLKDVNPYVSTSTGKSYLCNRALRPIGLWDVEVPTFSLDSRLTDGGKVVSLTRRTSFIPQEDSWYSFLLEAESPQGHSAVGKIR